MLSHFITEMGRELNDRIDELHDDWFEDKFGQFMTDWMGRHPRPFIADTGYELDEYFTVMEQIWEAVWNKMLAERLKIRFSPHEVRAMHRNLEWGRRKDEEADD